MLLEEIIVTVRRRNEGLQEVPIAVTALSGDDLRAHNIENFDDVQYHTPSLSVSNNGGSTPVIALRGQRPSETLLSVDPAVGMYFSDIVMTPSSGTNLSLYDLESVQVLKGPQGTLFGRNSTGGNVLFTPKSPDSDFGGYAEIAIGDYDLVRTEAAVNWPVSESLQLRIAGKTTNRDGYQTNRASGSLQGDDFGDENSTAVRVSVWAKITDNLENLTVVSWDRSDSKARVPSLIAWNPAAPAGGLLGAFFDLDGVVSRHFTGDKNDVETEVDGYQDLENRFVSNHTTLELDSLTIKNIIGYRKVESASVTDWDGTGYALLAPPASGAPSTTEGEQFSNEIQFLGSAFDDRLEWIVGGYYYQMQGTSFTRSNILAPFFPINPQIAGGDVDNEAYALFAQGTYQLSDQWSLTTGVRESWDDRAVTVTNFEAGVCKIKDAVGVTLPVDSCARTESESFSAPTWLLSLSYEPNNDKLLYANLGTGYRTGGINLRGKSNLELQPYEEETVLNYELGLKADWHPGNWTIRTNIATFYQDYQDIQRTQAVSDGTNFGTSTENAAEATIKGGELELWVIPFDGLEFSLNYAYVDAEYGEYSDSLTGEDLSNKAFPWVAKDSGTATVRYTLPLEKDIGQVSFQASYYYQGTVPTSAEKEFGEPMLDATLRQDSYSLVNLRFDWQGVLGSNFDFASYVKNANNEEYKTGGFGLLRSLGLATAFYGAPRTVGASLQYRF